MSVLGGCLSVKKGGHLLRMSLSICVVICILSTDMVKLSCWGTGIMSDVTGGHEKRLDARIQCDSTETISFGGTDACPNISGGAS